MWHGRLNLPLRHNKNDNEPYIHFPWENNSCALDASMSAWWIVYNKIYESAKTDITDIFEYEYKLINNIFKNLHEGIINNMEAKTEIRGLLKDCENKTYKAEGYITIDVLQMYIENNIYKRRVTPNDKKSIFHWYYDLIFSCESCNIEKKGLKRGTNMIYCGTKGDYIFNSFQEAINAYIMEDDFELSCELCSKRYTVKKKTEIQPHVLTITLPIIDKINKNTYKMDSIDQSIIFNNIEYELLAAVYGDNSHFVCRYLFGGNIYEADGMREYEIGQKKVKLHSAESQFISNDLVKDMNVTINNVLANRSPKQVADIYYIQKNSN